MLSLAPGSSPEDPQFVEDPELHAHDQFRDDVELDFRASRNDWAYVEKKRWDGWWKAETPDDWELLSLDESTRKSAQADKAAAASSRPIAWWDAAKGSVRILICSYYIWTRIFSRVYELNSQQLQRLRRSRRKSGGGHTSSVISSLHTFVSASDLSCYSWFKIMMVTTNEWKEAAAMKPGF